jgi:hypothetical protein
MHRINMMSIFAFLLVLISSPLSFADGGIPILPNNLHDLLFKAEAGVVTNSEPGPKFVFILQLPGLKAEDETNAHKHRYLRVNISNFTKMHSEPDGRISFADIQIIPATEEDIKKRIGGTHAESTQYAPITLQYKDYGLNGRIVKASAYYRGFGYSSDEVSLDEEELNAKAQKTADLAAKDSMDPTYDPSEESRKKEELLTQAPIEEFFATFAQFSADLAGLGYTSIRFDHKADFVNIEGVRFQGAYGLSMHFGKGMNLHLSVGGRAKLGAMVQVEKSSHFKIEDLQNSTELDGFIRAELLGRLAHTRLGLVLQGGANFSSDYQKMYSDSDQTSSAMRLGNGEGLSERAGGGHNDVGDMLFGSGGGNAEVNRYLMINGLVYF